MKKSVSNIAIPQINKDSVYRLMQKYGFTGLEIAPPRFIGERPYEKCEEGNHKANSLQKKYGFVIPSMQSLWYGIKGNIFVREEAEYLIEYTEKALRFANAVNCKNLVLGCPKNRNMPRGFTTKDAVHFFTKIAQMAADKGCVIALEANVKAYGTNFINTSAEAFAFAKEIPHLKVNYDLGTVIMNGEDLCQLSDNIQYVSHIHISENALAPITRRSLHGELSALLKEKNYSEFISIEMVDAGASAVCEAVEYVGEVFK